MPRWSLNCYWRRDGEPLWTDPALFADESKKHGADAAAAQRFLIALAERLSVSPQHVFAAYEDVLYYLWRERNLPANVDPLDSRLEDPLERARLARLFSEGLDKIAGHVLPLTRDSGGSQWQSGTWFLRAERCYLMPGDSPLGLRLPLDSLPWMKPTDYPYVYPPDTTAGRASLPRHAEIRKQLLHASREAGLGTRPVVSRDPSKVMARTAVCAEARNGVLYIFMPPTSRLEDYVELVNAVESVAQVQKQPIVMEGYEPPRDPRLKYFRVTPDPGVIEVNIHPAGGWDELVDRTTHLYDTARESRLSTEKFMLDGRHTGTGGGNHFVLGGADINDSPFLRRPDLLRSLISYWHNHPALS